MTYISLVMTLTYRDKAKYIVACHEHQSMHHIYMYDIMMWFNNGGHPCTYYGILIIVLNVFNGYHQLYPILSKTILI